MDALEDDFYRYEDVEHRLVGTSTGRVFRLGDHLRVKLTRADFDKRLLDFRLAGASAPQRTSRPAVIERAAPRRPAPRGPRGPERTPAGPARKPAGGPPRRRRR
jgi:ribonuclease R